MSNSSTRSFWSNRTARVSGLTVIAAAVLVGCGGGGGSDPASTVPDQKPLAVVTIKSVTIGTTNLGGAVVTPDEPAVVSVSYDAGGAQGAGTVSVTCAGTPIATAAAGATPTKLDFTHNPWAVGYCSGSVTVSAAGYASATQNFTFEVKAKAAVPLKYDAVAFVAGDLCKNVGLFKVEGTALQETLLVNKTVYQDPAVTCKLFLGAIAYQGDSVYKSTDGSMVVSYQTPGSGGNTRRYFVANPVTGEITKEIEAPAGITLRDTPYGTYGNTPYSTQGIGNIGMFASTSLGLLYFTDTDPQRIRLAPAGDFSASYVVGSTGYQLVAAVSN